MRRIAVVSVSLLLMTGLITGCGSSSSSSSSSGAGSSQSQAPSPPTSTTTSTSTEKTHFAKTKFVFHAGLAFGAFHRYIYKPFKTGAFTAAGKGRKAVIVAKGVLAALFIEHELRLAAHDVQSSPLLRHLFSPFTALAQKVRGIGSGLRGGQASAGDIQQANSQVGSLQSQSHAPDVTPPTSLAPTQ